MITKDESIQMADMFNWAQNNKDITVMELSNLTASDNEDILYKIECTMWVDNKFKYIVAMGFTLTKAMEQFGIKWTEKDFLDYKYFEKAREKYDQA